LDGNACADLAGCQLTFRRRTPGYAPPPDRQLHAAQRGSVGDMTASRKVRVLDIPVEEAMRRKGRGRAPSHFANALYLEWYSEFNGRVVLESTDFEVTITPPAWTFTDEDERTRTAQSAGGMTQFLAKLTQAVDARRFETPEDRAMDEFEWEKTLRESDARTEKFGELLEKYADHPDRDAIIDREMGWTTSQQGAGDGGEGAGEFDPASPEATQGDPEDRGGDELGDKGESEPQPDPAREGIDWVRTPDGRVEHPLVRRVMDGSIALFRRLKPDREANPDADLASLCESYTILGPKLGGALTALASGFGLEPGMTVALLKRAMKFLREAQAALERVAARGLMPPGEVEALRAELFAIREAMLEIMTRLRSAGND
jgi:hypothetical protein